MRLTSINTATTAVATAAASGTARADRIAGDTVNFHVVTIAGANTCCRCRTAVALGQMLMMKMKLIIMMLLVHVAHVTVGGALWVARWRVRQERYKSIWIIANGFR